MFWNSTYFHPCFVYFPYFKKHSRWLSYFSSGTGEDRVHCIASLVIFRPTITLVTTSRVVVDFPEKTGFGHQGSSFSVIFFKMGKNFFYRSKLYWGWYRWLKNSQHIWPRAYHDLVTICLKITLFSIIVLDHQKFWAIGVLLMHLRFPFPPGIRLWNSHIFSGASSPACPHLSHGTMWKGWVVRAAVQGRPGAAQHFARVLPAAHERHQLLPL